MEKVTKIDDKIKELKDKMRCANHYSIDKIRIYIRELEGFKEAILNAEIRRDVILDNHLEKFRRCLRNCSQPVYAQKPQTLPKPEADPWK